MDMGAVAEAVAAVLLGLVMMGTAAAAGSVQWWQEGPGVPGEVTYDHRSLVINGTRRMLFSGEIHYPRSTPELVVQENCRETQRSADRQSSSRIQSREMAVPEAAVAVVLLIGLAVFTSSSSAAAVGSVQRREKRPRVVRVGGVTYDHRALVLNGTRRMLLFSGEIHYPRSTPEVIEMSMCNMVAAAVLAALTALCTVPVSAEGRWSEERVRRDVLHDARALVVDGERRMMFAGEIHYIRSTPEMWPKLIAKAKEGGLDVIQTYVFWNVHEPIQGQYNFEGRYDLVKFIREIQAQGLYIENEYQMVEQAFGSSGQRYVSWVAAMAVNLQTGVPWTMCKQNDAPDPIIVPASRYLIYGNDTKLRSPEDIAFAVALFIARKNGSYVSYYMYHGGTNFGRFASSYVTTSYYDGAPLDEYGSNKMMTINDVLQAHVFETDSQCVAFLVNFDRHQISKVVFRNISLQLVPRSISILSDCNQVVFETSKVNAQRGSRSVKEVQSFNDVNTWKAFKEPIPQDVSKAMCTGNQLFEHLSTTKDETDYL
ncbi:hypothetical protein PR202_gb01313 [Eleusine coracana subsp. coracana]|uniref:beta-galactosidase n=1 Tax=Eleusine coracana subsp. coracana TaxID=191504 RepID=A0AAV5DVC1_ELECO|nr:hypothetical protein PR202_gb01313 [Eleusine coracana subsp. coracana]